MGRHDFRPRGTWSLVAQDTETFSAAAPITGKTQFCSETQIEMHPEFRVMALCAHLGQ